MPTDLFVSKLYLRNGSHMLCVLVCEDILVDHSISKKEKIRRTNPLCLQRLPTYFTVFDVLACAVLRDFFIEIKIYRWCIIHVCTAAWLLHWE